MIIITQTNENILNQVRQMYDDGEIDLMDYARYLRKYKGDEYE